MIALVTQFDDPSARPYVATPSGASSSSCCCCCVATVIGASIFSTIHVRSIRRQSLAAKTELRPADSLWPELLASVALIAALVAGGLLGAVTGGVLLFSVPLVWGSLLFAAYRGAGDDGRIGHAILTVIGGLLLGAVEFVIWLGALS